MILMSPVVLYRSQLQQQRQQHRRLLRRPALATAQVLTSRLAFRHAHLTTSQIAFKNANLRAQQLLQPLRHHQAAPVDVLVMI
jgi:hypothetical protein